MPDPSPGLLPHADRWSKIGLILGPSLAFALLGVNLGLLVAGEPLFLGGPLYTLAIATLITGTVVSAVVYVGSRIMRRQVRAMAELRGLIAAVPAVSVIPPAGPANVPTHPAANAFERQTQRRRRRRGASLRDVEMAYELGKMESERPDEPA